MKKIFLSCLAVSMVISVDAIIYRHDVPESEYRALALQPQFNCVGEVIKGHTTSNGTCVLIGDRYVLTAAHILIESENAPDTMYLYHGSMIKASDALKKPKTERDSMKRVIINTVVNRSIGDAGNYQCRFNRRMYQAKKIIIPSEYTDKTTKGSCDIALIELEEVVPGVAAAVLNKASDELGSIITNVGFGASGNASLPEDVGLYHVKLAGQNIVDSLSGSLYSGKRTLLGFDFDYPEQPQYNLLGGSSPLRLEHICGGGDSGGGMFRQTSKGWELVGICSSAETNIDRLLKIGYYGNKATYTRVSVFYDWIMKNIQ